MFIDYWEDNKHVVHIYNRVLLRHKNNKIQSFMTVEMGLEVMGHGSERVQTQTSIGWQHLRAYSATVVEKKAVGLNKERYQVTDKIPEC